MNNRIAELSSDKKTNIGFWIFGIAGCFILVFIVTFKFRSGGDVSEKSLNRHSFDLWAFSLIICLLTFRLSSPFYSEEVKQFVETGMDELINEYPKCSRVIHSIHSFFECCGTKSMDSWSTLNGSYPVSCCADKMFPCDSPYERTCPETIANVFKMIGDVIAITGVVIGAILLRFSHNVCLLSRSLNRERDSTSARKHSYERVSIGMWSLTCTVFCDHSDLNKSSLLWL